MARSAEVLEFVDELSKDISTFLDHRGYNYHHCCGTQGIIDRLGGQVVYNRPVDSDRERWADALNTQRRIKNAAKSFPPKPPMSLFGAPSHSSTFQWPTEREMNLTSARECTNYAPLDTLLKFSSCFESANLKCSVFQRSQSDMPTYDLVLDHDVNTNGHTQWFYFAVRNTTAKRVRFRIVNFCKTQSLYRRGMQPRVWSEKEAFLYMREKMNSPEGIGEDDMVSHLWKAEGSNISYQRNQLPRPRPTYREEKEDIGFGMDRHPQHMHEQAEHYSKIRKGPKHLYTFSFEYVFKHSEDCVYFSYSYPYTYTNCRTFLQSIENHPFKSQWMRRKRLCHTLGGVECDIVGISNWNIPRKQKKGIMVVARVHPGESNASWMVHGLMNFLLGNNPEAHVLRDHFLWKIVPMINPDGVICGNYRCGLAGVDLNRQWRHPEALLHRTIHEAKKQIIRLKESSEVAMFLDLHGHSRKFNCFAYSCANQGDDARNDSVRMYPKLVSLITPDFSYRSCRWNCGLGKRGTGRVVVCKDIGLPASYTIEASFFASHPNPNISDEEGGSDESDGDDKNGEESGDGNKMGKKIASCGGPVPFTSTRLQKIGSELSKAVLMQYHLGYEVAMVMRSRERVLQQEQKNAAPKRAPQSPEFQAAELKTAKPVSVESDDADAEAKRPSTVQPEHSIPISVPSTASTTVASAPSTQASSSSDLTVLLRDDYPTFECALDPLVDAPTVEPEDEDPAADSDDESGDDSLTEFDAMSSASSASEGSATSNSSRSSSTSRQSNTNVEDIVESKLVKPDQPDLRFCVPEMDERGAGNLSVSINNMTRPSSASNAGVVNSCGAADQGVKTNVQDGTNDDTAMEVEKGQSVEYVDMRTDVAPEGHGVICGNETGNRLEAQFCARIPRVDGFAGNSGGSAFGASGVGQKSGTPDDLKRDVAASSDTAAVVPPPPAQPEKVELRDEYSGKTYDNHKLSKKKTSKEKSEDQKKEKERKRKKKESKRLRKEKAEKVRIEKLRRQPLLSKKEREKKKKDEMVARKLEEECEQKQAAWAGQGAVSTSFDSWGTTTVNIPNEYRPPVEELSQEEKNELAKRLSSEQLAYLINIDVKKVAESLNEPEENPEENESSSGSDSNPSADNLNPLELEELCRRLRKKRIRLRRIFKRDENGTSNRRQRSYRTMANSRSLSSTQLSRKREHSEFGLSQRTGRSGVSDGESDHLLLKKIVAFGRTTYLDMEKKGVGIPGVDKPVKRLPSLHRTSSKLRNMSSECLPNMLQDSPLRKIVTRWSSMQDLVLWRSGELPHSESTSPLRGNNGGSVFADRKSQSQVQSPTRSAASISLNKNIRTMYVVKGGKVDNYTGGQHEEYDDRKMYPHNDDECSPYDQRKDSNISNPYSTSTGGGTSNSSGHNSQSSAPIRVGGERRNGGLYNGRPPNLQAPAHNHHHGGGSNNSNTSLCGAEVSALEPSCGPVAHSPVLVTRLFSNNGNNNGSNDAHGVGTSQQIGRRGDSNNNNGQQKQQSRARSILLRDRDRNHALVAPRRGTNWWLSSQNQQQSMVYGSESRTSNGSPVPGAHPQTLAHQSPSGASQLSSSNQQQQQQSPSLCKACGGTNSTSSASSSSRQNHNHAHLGGGLSSQSGNLIPVLSASSPHTNASANASAAALGRSPSNRWVHCTMNADNTVKRDEIIISTPISIAVGGERGEQQQQQQQSVSGGCREDTLASSLGVGRQVNALRASPCRRSNKSNFREHSHDSKRFAHSQGSETLVHSQGSETIYEEGGRTKEH